MNITLATLADAANTTRSGKLNLLGAFQAIYTPAVPCQHPHCALVLMMRADIGEKGTTHGLRIRMIDPEAKPVMEMELDVEIGEESHFAYPEIAFILELKNLLLAQYGQHVFEIYLDNKREASINLAVAPLVSSLKE